MAEGERGDSPPNNVPDFVTTTTATTTPTSWLDLPAKNLVRQLDFNAMMMEQSKLQQHVQHGT